VPCNGKISQQAELFSFSAGRIVHDRRVGAMVSYDVTDRLEFGEERSKTLFGGLVGDIAVLGA
jgi:hypothetical protein